MTTIAEAVAPFVRSIKRGRLVGVVRPSDPSWRPYKHIDALDVTLRVLAKDAVADLAVSLDPTTCLDCGKKLKYQTLWHARKHGGPKARARCADCFRIRKKHQQRTCAGKRNGDACSRPVPGNYVFCPVNVTARNGEPWRCRSCARTVHVEVPLCKICGAPSTHNSAAVARSNPQGTAGRCAKHARVRLTYIPVPCAICGATVPTKRGLQARSRGANAYCDDHKPVGAPISKSALERDKTARQLKDRGMTRRQIASELNVSERVVKAACRLKH